MNADPRPARVRTLPRLLLAAAMLAPSAAVAEAPGEVMEFSLASGATLIGDLKGRQIDGEWLVESPDATGQIRLKPASVRSMTRLSGGTPRENSPRGLLVFLSGDRVPADISAFDGSSFSVRVPWSEGERPVKWNELERIVFADSGVRRVFAGPLPEQEWKFTTGPERAGNRKEMKNAAWRVESGALAGKGPGSASIEAKLPEQVMIQFDLEWTGLLSLSLGMYGDSFDPSDKDKPNGPTVVEAAARNNEVIPLREGIALDINQHAAILRSHSAEQGQDMLGSGQMPQEFRNRGSARFTVRLDRPAGICGLWYGERLVQKWNDLGNLAMRGNSLSFWQHHSNGTVAIRRIVVQTWNGKFDDETPAAEEDRDVLVATDGTKLSGKIGPLANGTFAIESGVGNLDVALADSRHLVRATGKEAKSDQHKPAGALLTLAGGAGQFHVEAFRVEDEGKTMIGKHREMGELILPSTEVESVEFPSTSDKSEEKPEETPGEELPEEL